MRYNVFILGDTRGKIGGVSCSTSNGLVTIKKSPTIGNKSHSGNSLIIKNAFSFFSYSYAFLLPEINLFFINCFKKVPIREFFIGKNMSRVSSNGTPGALSFNPIDLILSTGFFSGPVILSFGYLPGTVEFFFRFSPALYNKLYSDHDKVYFYILNYSKKCWLLKAITYRRWGEGTFQGFLWNFDVGDLLYLYVVSGSSKTAVFSLTSSSIIAY